MKYYYFIERMLMIKIKSKLMRRTQIWALLLIFLGSWSLASAHQHEAKSPESSHCATCHFQQQIRSSDLGSIPSVALPTQAIESLQIPDLALKPSLLILLTKRSQAPPQV